MSTHHEPTESFRDSHRRPLRRSGLSHTEGVAVCEHHCRPQPGVGPGDCRPRTMWVKSPRGGSISPL